MEPAHELELLEAIHRAKELQRGVEEAARGFPPEGVLLAQQLRAAANRAVTNLELALAALRREQAGSS
jgi:hypothetical protein